MWSHTTVVVPLEWKIEYTQTQLHINTYLCVFFKLRYIHGGSGFILLERIMEIMKLSHSLSHFKNDVVIIGFEAKYASSHQTQKSNVKKDVIYIFLQIIESLMLFDLIILLN